VEEKPFEKGSFLPFPQTPIPSFSQTFWRALRAGEENWLFDA